MYADNYMKGTDKRRGINNGKGLNFNNEDLILQEVGGKQMIDTRTPYGKTKVLYDAENSPYSNKLVSIRPESS